MPRGEDRHRPRILRVCWKVVNGPRPPNREIYLTPSICIFVAIPTITDSKAFLVSWEHITPRASPLTATAVQGCTSPRGARNHPITTSPPQASPARPPPPSSHNALQTSRPTLHSSPRGQPPALLGAYISRERCPQIPILDEAREERIILSARPRK